MLLDKREHETGAPRGDHVQIGGKISTPRTRHSGIVVLARAERDADATVDRAGANRSDFERVRPACP
ncbi:hypothetical protein [Bradyrhizobium sp. ARR65]|uniref:hypothetical protein n=1 Tax=Bradyrhizobium sp. ARR65 TaxID=1040989 RepID=UPI001FD9305E|nr:hypothetical protein [Bradyrhizobium sp. ARR65]